MHLIIVVIQANPACIFRKQDSLAYDTQPYK
jgi:hypothetical protein